MSQDYKFSPPWQFDDWYIFPDAILDNLDLSDCNDTVNGVCTHTETLQDCINLCQQAGQQCQGGYMIEAKDKNYCVPLLNYQDESLSPYYRYRNKNIYPQLRNVHTYMFNRTAAPFPPDIPNVIFYTDNFVLKNVERNVHIGHTDDETSSQDVIFTPQEAIHVQLLPGQTGRNYIEHYVTVRNGDSVVINIPKTTFVLRPKDNNKDVGWLMRASLINAPENTFVIHHTDPTVPIGTPLTYSDQFYFTYQNHPLIFDYEHSQLLVEPISLDNAIAKKLAMTFEFVPKVEVYYCDNGNCKSISLDKTDRSGVTARYNGRPAVRSPVCWGVCQTEKRSIYPLIIGLVLALFAAGVLFWFWRRRR